MNLCLSLWTWFPLLLVISMTSMTSYHIQTDEGDSRFFQFSSSGNSEQYRREAILPNGSVEGVYSWVDEEGSTRLFTYKADHLGYRVRQFNLVKEENEGKKEDRRQVRYDPRKVEHKTEEKVKRPKRKIIVRRRKGGRQLHMLNVSSEVITKRPGKPCQSVIPYQEQAASSSGQQQETVRSQETVRLIGAQGLITVLRSGRREQRLLDQDTGTKLTTQVLDQKLPYQVLDQELPYQVLLNKVRANELPAVAGIIDKSQDTSLLLNSVHENTDRRKRRRKLRKS